LIELYINIIEDVIPEERAVDTTPILPLCEFIENDKHWQVNRSKTTCKAKEKTAISGCEETPRDIAINFDKKQKLAIFECLKNLT